MKKNFAKYIFSVDTKTTNRVIIYIFGIKIRFLKPGFKENNEKYIKYDCKINEIPPATGNFRKIQLANLKIVKIFKELCEQNSLEYWLDHGSLLGAFRHKGFIPWDDDVDVSMIRQDYEKFIDLFLEKIPTNDDLYLEFCNNGRNKCFLKLKHKDLENIGIDIFPYDYYYKKLDEEEKISEAQRIKKYFKSQNLIYRILQPLYIHSQKLMRNRRKKVYESIILKKNSINPDQKPALIYGFDYPHFERTQKPFFDYETIFPLKKITFENEEFLCPNIPEKVLKQLYDDYMSLPKDCYARHTNAQGINELKIEEFINK